MQKILEIEELTAKIREYKKNGKTVALCHGCFDLVHPGHIRHFKEAARQADYLIVTVTPDRYVAKGPSRPLFPEQMRLEQLAALDMVHHVALNQWPTAVETLNLLKPNIYVKGADYEDKSKDITGNIQREIDAVERYGGRIYITHDIVFSSTKLINRSFQLLQQESQNYVDGIRNQYSADDLEALIDRFSSLRVLILGDTIIDEYCYCKPMGRVEKAPIISMKYLYEERYPGGILAVANHAAQYADDVRLITTIGDGDNYGLFARKHLNSSIQAELIVRNGSPTVTKRRFLTAEGKTKVFEVGWINDECISGELEDDVLNKLEDAVKGADLIIAADFGHGLITPRIIDFLESQSIPFALNAQTNSTNFGYNYITRYRNVDFLSIDENEIRLPFQSRLGKIEDLVYKLADATNCRSINITLGSEGSLYFSDGELYHSPALASKVVDTVGAGDAVFSVLSLAYKSGFPLELMPFLGNSVGALAVEIMGNKEPVYKTSLIKFLRGLMA